VPDADGDIARRVNGDARTEREDGAACSQRRISTAWLPFHRACVAPRFKPGTSSREAGARAWTSWRLRMLRVFERIE
jgi:hypothetical protein